eukprot:TRINITY_DN71341_c0_g1_i1.p1 TRINITY_DN71341_c0_g1~~TRINITY_DN71341_c0_g1_i1.p1  ORF type:complete len:548 (+),score=84.78 TRINITY_DN71341_c0_g1_i1:76-1719(+)
MPSNAVPPALAAAQLPPGAWGSGPSVPSPIDELLVSRLPGESGLGLGLVGLQLQGVAPGSPAERCGALAFIGRNLRAVNGAIVHTVGDVATLAGSVGPVRLTFESKEARTERRQLREARRLQLGADGRGKLQAGAAADVHNRQFVLRRADGRQPLGFNLREPELTIDSVHGGSPADLAGVGSCVGRRLLAVDGVPVVSAADFAAHAHGKRVVRVTISGDVVGCVLRRSSATDPLGFAVAGRHLELARVDPGSPAEAAGMHSFLGCGLSHVDDLAVFTPEDVAAACRRKREVFFRFVSLPEDASEGSGECVTVPEGSAEDNSGVPSWLEVIVERSSGGFGLALQTLEWPRGHAHSSRGASWLDHSYGSGWSGSKESGAARTGSTLSGFAPESEASSAMHLTGSTGYSESGPARYVVISGVDPGSPAQAAGLGAYLGMRVSEVDRIPMYDAQDVAVLLGNRARVRLRLELPPGPVEHRTTPEDVQKYQEWRRARLAAKANAALPVCGPREHVLGRLPPASWVVPVRRPLDGDWVTGGPLAHPGDLTQKY